MLPRGQVPPWHGTLYFNHTIRLAPRRADRGVCFSPPMDASNHHRVLDVLATDTLSDLNRWALLKLVAANNYFSTEQVTRARGLRASRNL